MTTPANIHPEEPGAVAMLDQAITALSTALDNMPIAQVASLKAKIATIATATKQLGMSKEAQEYAAEAVRRSEWALRQAQQRAQESGEMASRESNLRNNPRNDATSTTADLPKPRDMFASEVEYRDALAMGELNAEQFDEVITEAKAEGNLSRANVARKAREKAAMPAKARPRPDAERTLNALVMHAEKAAREAKNLTPDQLRRIKPKADLWTVGLRESVEALQGLLTSLTEEQ